MVESLVIPFAVVMRDVLRHCVANVPLSDRNQPVQAFFFDRPHEPFRVSVSIRSALGDQDNADPCLPQSTPPVTGPRPNPIADQEVRRGNLAVQPRDRGTRILTAHAHATSPPGRPPTARVIDRHALLDRYRIVRRTCISAMRLKWTFGLPFDRLSDCFNSSETVLS